MQVLGEKLEELIGGIPNAASPVSALFARCGGDETAELIDELELALTVDVVMLGPTKQRNWWNCSH
jgi:hypothetical protein